MPTSAKIPIVLISTPVTVIHACNVPLVSARGSPEAKPRKVMTAIFLLRNTWRYGVISAFMTIHLSEDSVRSFACFDIRVSCSIISYPELYRKSAFKIQFSRQTPYDSLLGLFRRIICGNKHRGLRELPQDVRTTK